MPLLHPLTRFEQVLTLPGHRGAVWGLDVSPDGAFCVTTGQDRSIRFWARGDDLGECVCSACLMLVRVMGRVRVRVRGVG